MRDGGIYKQSRSSAPVIEGLSVVANYRSQFNRILANGSFDDLLKRLKEKETKLGN